MRLRACILVYPNMNIEDLNTSLAEFHLEASQLREICPDDRWSKLLTTGKERDLHGQKGYITFHRKVSEEEYIVFGIYFPRIEYSASPQKIIYKITNGKKVLEAIRVPIKNESLEGCSLTQQEMDIFMRWFTYTCDF